ncbi:MAG: COX15/CtaA family protein [Acidobacteria bacterium]|nr:COX15/CtaA family protein [Acidobacteriota bacterium]
MQKLAWAFVGYLIFVILFGAWVRISGSGAGCGNHWPTCQGVVLPVEPSVKTMIEFTHRITSGLSGLMGLALLVWAWRKKSPALPWAAGMFFFLLVEGFIGAVLVKKELVENDASMSRAVVISLHLVNTMLLMLCAVGTAVKAGAERYRNAYVGGLIWLAMAVLVITNATGAVTALGDTIFPIQPSMGPELIAKIREDISPGQHFLIRLRVVHPVIAAITATIVFGVLSFFQRRNQSRWALAGMGLVVIQVALGVGNIWLAAPGWMQISHLLTAQLLWVTIVAVWLD